MKFFDILRLGCVIIAAHFAIAAPAIAHTAPLEEVAVEAPVADSKPALWVVKDDDTTIYLFGTVHILPPGLGWFDGAVKDAFDASDELVTEIIDPDPSEAAQLMISFALDSEGISLRDRLSDEERARYEDALTSIDYPIYGFDKFEPWFAAITLSYLPLLQKGYDVENGVEKELARAAKTANKPVSALETHEEQLAIFDNLPMDSQIAYLNKVIESFPNIENEIEKLITGWNNADIDALESIMNDGLETPDSELYDVLLTRRNENWAQWIKKRLDQPGTIFVAVGAGHLAGPDSVQAQLQKLDIETQQIAY